MTHLDALPAWVALPCAVLVLLGSGLTLLGTAGLLGLPRFYDRLHAPTLGSSWGTFAIVLASMAMFSALEGRPVLHDALIAVLVTVTTPVTLMLLGRAALHRDRAEGSTQVPPGRAGDAPGAAPPPP